jgi:hypothetical protein
MLDSLRTKISLRVLLLNRLAVQAVTGDLLQAHPPHQLLEIYQLVDQEPLEVQHQALPLPITQVFIPKAFYHLLLLHSPWLAMAETGEMADREESVILAVLEPIAASVRLALLPSVVVVALGGLATQEMAKQALAKAKNEMHKDT